MSLNISAHTRRPALFPALSLLLAALLCSTAARAQEQPDAGGGYSFLAPDTPDAGTTIQPASAVTLDSAMASFANGDYKKAQSNFWTLATQGDPQAQYYLGYMMDSGIGKTGRDPILGFNWFKKSAEQGYLPAMVQMGYALSSGRGVGRNQVEAMEWYAKAAQMGDPVAQNNLATLLRQGKPFRKEPKLAAQWFTLSAQQGNARAQYNLATMYRAGEGVEKNEAEAIKWYTLAARQNDVYAQNALGYMYSAGIGAPKNTKTAEQWYALAAKQEHMPSQMALARIYESHGTPEDTARAIALYAAAAKKNNPDAMLRLGRIYELGTGVKKDTAEAFRLYRRAAEELRHPPAVIFLARMHESGTGTPQNLQKAAELYERAANSGDADAMLETGRVYNDGIGVQKNSRTAYIWFALAAENQQDRDRKADAVIARINISKSMTQSDIASANTEVQAWQPPKQAPRPAASTSGDE